MNSTPPRDRGARAEPTPRAPESVVLVGSLAVLVWALRVLHQGLCNTSEATLNTMLRLCYSDLPVIWQDGIGQGVRPSASDSFDLPVLVGHWVGLMQQLTFVLAPVNDDPHGLQGVTTFFVGLSTLLLGLFFLGLVGCLLMIGRGHPRRGVAQPVGLLMATSVLVLASGTISFDLIPAALVGLTLLLWSRSRPVWAGVALGLAASAAWYPLVIVVVLYVLCRRAGRTDAWGRLVLAALPIWLLANLPMLVTNPAGWSVQARRWLAPDIGYGSVWYLLQSAFGWNFPAWTISAVLLLAALTAISVLASRAPRRPRVAQLVALAVLAITLTMPVFSPQNVIWLVPLVALARPVTRDWVIFSAGELIYWATIWGYLQNNLFSPAPAAVYAMAVFVRLGVEGYLVRQIVRDVVHPWTDPVRAEWVDDPTGGVLDHASDEPHRPRQAAPLGGSRVLEVSEGSE